MFNIQYKFLLFLVSFLWNFLWSSCAHEKIIYYHPCASTNFNIHKSLINKKSLKHTVKSLSQNTDLESELATCHHAFLGQAYLILNQANLSSHHFSLASKSSDVLSHYFLLAQAFALVQAKNFSMASKIAKQILQNHPSKLISIKASHILANIAKIKRDNKDIINTHNNLLKNKIENKTILYDLALAYKRNGQEKETFSIHKKLMARYPSSKEAKQIYAKETLLSLNSKELESRFNILIAHSDISQILSDIDILLKENNLPAETWSVIIKSLMQSHHFNKAFQINANLTLNNHTNRLKNQAYALAKMEHAIDAAKTYDQHRQNSIDKEDKGQACFFGGFSLYEKSLYTLALTSWEHCLEDIKNTSSYENYLWYNALTNILLDKHNTALSILKKLTTNFLNAKEIEKYHYFLALSLNNLNDTQQSKLIWQKLASKPKLGYYQILSRQALNVEIPTLRLKEPTIDMLQHMSDNDGVIATRILFNVGLKEEALDNLSRLSLSSNLKLALLQSMGFHHEAFLKAKPINLSYSNEKNVSAEGPIYAHFPRPHFSTIEEIGRQFSLNPYLIFAIMKTESNFNEKATSHRGAQGLMQVMPFLAQRLQYLINHNNFDLTNPKSTILFGTLTLAILTRQFANDHLIIAAYNAGAHNIQKWQHLFGYLPKDIFIERIPFKETREYVKKVMAEQSLYQALYQGDQT